MSSSAVVSVEHETHLNFISIRYCSICHSVYFDDKDFESHHSLCPHKGVILLRIGNEYLSKFYEIISKQEEFAFYYWIIYEDIYYQ